MIVEVIGGLLSNSLALLADAGHMVTDAAAIALALFAMWLSTQPYSPRRSFGFHRTEVLAAMVNAVSLWVIAAIIFWEAYRRFTSPPEVEGVFVLAVGLAGLGVNVLAAIVLRGAAHHSLNVEGVMLHVLSDMAGSIGVVISGVLIALFGWYIADPIAGVVIGVLVLISSGRLLWKVSHVLMEGTPSSLDLQQLCDRIERVPGVGGVHDIHAWTITSGYEVLSAHVTLDRDAPKHHSAILQEVRDIATKEFGIAHTTIQLEESERGCPEGHHTEHGGVAQ